ncbi:MAG: FG-GAP repeat domain-containing protein, partial [Candidatus Helarchaeota archaeon]
MIMNNERNRSQFFLSRKKRLKLLSTFILSIFTLSILVGMIIQTGLLSPILSSLIRLNKNTSSQRVYYNEIAEYIVTPEGDIKSAISCASDLPFLKNINNSLTAYDRVVTISLAIFNGNSTYLEKFQNGEPWNNQTISNITLSLFFPSDLELLDSELTSYGDEIVNNWNQIMELNGTSSALSFVKSNTFSGRYLDYDVLIYTASFNTDKNFSHFVNIANNSLPEGLKELFINSNIDSRDSTIYFEWINVDLFNELTSMGMPEYYQNTIYIYQNIPDYFGSPYTFNTSRNLNIGTLSGLSSIKPVNDSYAMNINSKIDILIKNAKLENSTPDVSDGNVTYSSEIDLDIDMMGLGETSNINVNFTAPVITINRTLPIGNNFGDYELIELEINNLTEITNVEGLVFDADDYHYSVERFHTYEPELSFNFTYNGSIWSANMTAYLLTNGQYVLDLRAISNTSQSSYYSRSFPNIDYVQMGLNSSDINIINSANILFDVINPQNNSIVSIKNNETLNFSVNITSPFSIQKAWGKLTNQYGHEENGTNFAELFQFHDMDSDPLILTSACIVDINNDGIDDVLGIRDQNNGYREVSAYINNGSGIFGEPLKIYVNNDLISNDIACGDFNNDSLSDFVVSIYDSGSSVQILEFWINNVSNPGNFYFYKNLSLSNYAYYLASADFDGNNFSDVIISDTSQNVYLYLNNGTDFNQDAEIFSSPFYDGSSCSLAVGDFNNDTTTDVVIQHGSQADLWTNDGNANFTAWGQVQPNANDLISSIGSGDVNGDGITEILFGYYGGNIRAMSYKNGTFNQHDDVAYLVEYSSNYGNFGIINLDASGDLNNDTLNDLIANSYIESKDFKNLNNFNHDNLIELVYDAGSGLWNGTLYLSRLTFGNQSIEFYAKDIHNAIGSSNTTFNIYINNTYFEDILRIGIFDGGVSLTASAIGPELYVDINESIPELDGVQSIFFIAYTDNQSTAYDHRINTGDFFSIPPTDVHIIVTYTNFFNTRLSGPDRTANEMNNRVSVIESELERVFNTGTELQLLSICDENNTGMFSNLDYLVYGMNYSASYNFSTAYDDFYLNYAKGSKLLNVFKDGNLNETDGFIEIIWNRPGVESYNPNQFHLGSRVFPEYDTGNVNLLVSSDVYDSYWLHETKLDKEFFLSQTLNKTATNLIEKPNSTADLVRSTLKFQCIDDFAERLSDSASPIARYTSYSPNHNVTLQNYNVTLSYGVWINNKGLNVSNDLEVNLTVPLVIINSTIDPVVSGNVSITANITSENGVD